MNTPAMIIDFEATDVSKEAEATQLGYRRVSFDDEGCLWAEPMYSDITEGVPSHTVSCKPDRRISYGAMAVSHITPEMVENEPSHKEIANFVLPKGEAYIIAHNADYDIQVAANAGVDVSQYKAICTQALARQLIPCIDSYSLGALTYYINPDRAKQYCRNAHDAGYDVTFTLWLLEYLCKVGSITSMEQLYLASEEARIPLTFTFGKHQGKTIKDIAVTDRSYLQWIIKNHDNAYLVKACLDAITGNININV
ncbi:exodeoxyribonuclease X C-terminal domain-containing protein [Psychrobacter sp. ASPA161_6]|uniref:exodeoxyribonuclease X C-terminal domain-containing protein n=1 Tax=Psychrobacter sp. ASPA161_6 TaxID=3160962 RepID=UPI003F80CDD5